MNLVKVKSAQPGDLPISKNTAYKYHSQGRFPGLIFKVPGIGLVFDLDESERMCEAAKEKNLKLFARVNRPLGK